MDISVVIVSWNAKRYLEACLESLEAVPSRRSVEVIVLDNASSDSTVEMVEKRFPNVQLIKSEQNLGFAKGNNVAIRRCQGRYIALVNPDVVMFPGCLDALADFLDENPKVGNVGPRVLNPDMTLQSTCRKFPSLWNNFCAAAGLSTAFKKSRFLAGEHMLYFPHDRTLNVDVLVGCFSMIRRETFNEVGLLDEELFMYGDDVDWCRRCWKAGWQVTFFPGAIAIHDRGKTTAPYPVRFAVAQQRSILHYWRKYHGFWAGIGIRSIIFSRHLVRVATAAIVGFLRESRSAEAAVRKQVSGACLRELFSASFSNDHRIPDARPSK
jgi:GT2 family glycosyltransferase